MASVMPDVHHLLQRIHHWGDCRPIQLLGGNRNTVLLIARQGECLVAKTTTRTPESIAWVAMVQAHAEAAGLTVPTLIASQQGNLVEDGVTVERWLEGEVASDAERRQALPQLQAFHERARHVPQRPGFASTTALLTESCGGDVDLATMPAGLVEVCRSAWQALVGEPVSAVHGDLNPENVLKLPDEKLALIDWDEARVDASLLDEMALVPRGDGEAEQGGRVRRALLAWEAAVSWHVEPAYAQRVAQELEDDRDHRPG